MSAPFPRRRGLKIAGIVVAVLVVVLVVAVLMLDRVLTSKAQEQAALLSSELGRPVTVGSVGTKLLGGLGVKVSDVGIGAGPGETLPLLQLPRAEVKAAALRAIFSGGKDIEVREVVVDGLRLNVVRLPDGTTNVQRVQQALARRQAEKAPAEAKPEQPSRPMDLSRVHVRRAAIENARIAFLDQAARGAKELAIDRLEVEVRDLEAGRPLEVVLKAAVLAQRQNLEFRLKSAPLPPSLVPTPTELVLKAEPIDLAPLAPFVPKTVGLRGGRFQADLAATLGAAVPGGSGPTKVKGGLQATQLAFAGAEAGKPLDVVLQADLQGDADKGDLDIRTLRLDAGPAGLTGRGRAFGLNGDHPRVEGLEIVGHDLDPAVLAAYYPPLRSQLKGSISGPIGLSLRASGTQGAQALELRVDLTPVRLAIPAQLTKAAGAPTTLLAHADASQGGGNVRFDAALDLAGADLRPGGTLAKAPGDPLTVKLAGTYRKSGEDVRVALSTIDVTLLRDRLGGTANVAMGGPPGRRTTRFDADVRGARLDLDRDLVPTPEAGKGQPPPQKKPPNPAVYAGVSGFAQVRIDVVRKKGLDLRNFLARLRMQEDQVTLEEARFDAFGGTLSAAGTQMKLAHPSEPYRIVAAVKSVEASQASRLLSDRQVVSGKLDGKLDLTAVGSGADALAKSASGSLAGALQEGAFHGKDLVASVAAPLAKALPFAAPSLPKTGGATSLGKNLPFAFRIANGFARLEKPLQVSAGDANIRFDGGARMDGTLDMPTTVALSPNLVARITGGRARPSEPIPVAFRLTGPAWGPSLSDLQLQPAVEAIARQAAVSAVGRALGIPGGNAAAQQKAAEKKAADEAARQQKKLEEEAQKRLKGLFGR